MTVFDSLEEAPGDPILDLNIAYKQDTRDSKVNLSVGAYKDSEGLPFVLNCVRNAEKLVFKQHLNKEYPPISGNKEYSEASISLVFGKNFLAERVFGAQTLGGTGALRIGGEFLARNTICSTIYLSDPTWGNHLSIFRNAGLNLDTYNYYDPLNHTVNFKAMCESIRKIPSNSAILLQPCCHNPTGTDLTYSQWEELCFLIKEQKIIPFFDLAYQGFDKGLEEDAKVIRLFAQHHPSILVASSYSKNMGLYGERAGHLAILCKDDKIAHIVGSHVKRIIRASYSMPPLHSGRIVAAILTTDSLKKEWIEELGNIRGRIQEMRRILFAGLSAKGQGETFEYLTHQTGMFSFSGMNPDQTHRLKEKQGIYMLKNGRINIAGLNSENIDYFVDAILAIYE